MHCFPTQLVLRVDPKIFEQSRCKKFKTFCLAFLFFFFFVPGPFAEEVALSPTTSFPAFFGAEVNKLRPAQLPIFIFSIATTLVGQCSEPWRPRWTVPSVPLSPLFPAPASLSIGCTLLLLRVCSGATYTWQQMQNLRLGTGDSANCLVSSS